jgi:hypothetical protein
MENNTVQITDETGELLTVDKDAWNLIQAAMDNPKIIQEEIDQAVISDLRAFRKTLTSEE